MIYVGWAVFYEANSDALYLDVLLPRVIRDLVAREGTQLADIPDLPAVRLGIRSRSVKAVAAEACAAREAYHVVFIHADTGGRGVEQGLADRADAYCLAMAELCSWPSQHCITITPRHETEAWLLADGAAVTEALGYSGNPSEIGLPPDAQSAERLSDPKRVLSEAVERVAGRRRVQRIENLFPAIAQRQQLDLLRKSASFLEFEERLRQCLRALRCVA